MHQAKFVNDIDYAGEICLLESSIERAQVQLSLTAEPAASMGLLINTSKTEYMSLNCPGNQKLKVRSEALNQGKRLPLTTIHGSWQWQRLQAPEGSCLNCILEPPENLVFTSNTCLFVLLYDCETWIMTKDMNAKLNAFATSYYRIMLNTIGLEKVSKVRIYDLTDTILMLQTVMSSQLKFFGHILRFEKDKPADIYTLQMMIMMISGMPGKSDGGQNANGVGQGICLLSLFSRTKRTMPLIS